MRKFFLRYLVYLVNLEEKKLLNKCYTSIDELPIFYWRKINESSNLSFLIKSDIISLNKKQHTKIRQVALSKIWERLYDEYILMFGFSEDFKEIQRKKVEQAIWRLRMIAENNKSFNFFVNLCQTELDAMIKAQNDGSNFYETKGYIESSLGIQIDEMKTSTAQFYSYIKLAQSKSANGRGSD